MELKKNYAPLVNMAVWALGALDRSELAHLRRTSEMSYELARYLLAKTVTSVTIRQLREQIPELKPLDEERNNGYVSARNEALDFITETRALSNSIAGQLMVEVFGSHNTPHERGLEDIELADHLFLFHALASAMIERIPGVVVDE